MRYLLNCLTKRAGRTSMSGDNELNSARRRQSCSTGVAGGLSASEWEQRNAKVVRVGWMLVVLLVPIIIGVKSGIVWLELVAIATMILGFSAITWYNVGLGASSKRAREHAAGYTTEWEPCDGSLDLCAPRTGVVIRSAGSPQITREHYQSEILKSERIARAADGR